jgi:DUF4097 and DUF4098 domain-containing protein YvlB
LENVICQGEIKVANTSGSIDLERCDALSFDLHTTSGGIRGSILTAKTFDCKSTSGGVHTPNDGNGGTFRARSTSGGINITGGNINIDGNTTIDSRNFLQHKHPGITPGGSETGGVS